MSFKKEKKILQIKLKTKNDQKEQQPPSPTFGVKQKQEEDPINLAGKTGKSHHAYFKYLNSVSDQNSYRQITRKELAQHTTKESAWLSLDSQVYDVTNYIAYHPGGKIMLQGCGKECRELFNKYQYWVNGKFLLQKFKLGHLCD